MESGIPAIINNDSSSSSSSSSSNSSSNSNDNSNDKTTSDNNNDNNDNSVFCPFQRWSQSKETLIVSASFYTNNNVEIEVLIDSNLPGNVRDGPQWENRSVLFK